MPYNPLRKQVRNIELSVKKKKKKKKNEIAYNNKTIKQGIAVLLLY